MSDAAKKDPALYGQVKYDRAELDFYPSPPDTVHALLQSGRVPEDLDTFWEPACGDGAISSVLKDTRHNVISTDISDYGYPEGSAGIDFLKTRVVKGRIIPHVRSDYRPSVAGLRDDVARLQKPFGIITNPPYNIPYRGISLDFVRKALEVTEPNGGFVAMLLRHEWDSGVQTQELTDHPAYAGRVTLRYRPRWIKGSTGSPRHNYAWFLWDWSSDQPAQCTYANRPSER